MWDELEEIRELQILQEEAIAAGDIDLALELDADRTEVTAELVERIASGEQPDDPERFRALSAELRARDAALVADTIILRDALAGEIARLGAGRAAIGVFRVGGPAAHLLDTTG